MTPLGRPDRPGGGSFRTWGGPVLAALLVVGVTLVPGGATGTPMSGWCLLCGSRGSADAILNTLLFVPLGALLARRWSPRPGSSPAGDAFRTPASVAFLGAGAVAFLLSLGVEVVQILLPARDASPSDVFFNTLGGLVGAGLWLRLGAWLRVDDGPAALVCTAAAVGATGVLAVTGLALAPSLTRSDYWGQWTPDLGHLESYGGLVLEATVGGLAVTVGRSGHSGTLRALLRSGADVRTLFLAGPPPPGVAPVFSIYDRQEREIMLLGVSGDDVVFRIRRRADHLKLDRPDTRLPGALAGRLPGDTVRATAFVEGGRRCLRTDPGPGACGIGPTLTDGWSLLYHVEPLSGRARPVLGALWIALLCMPVGLWLRQRSLCALAIALPLAALWLLPEVTTPEPTPPEGYAGAVAGFLIGALAAARARRRTAG